MTMSDRGIHPDLLEEEQAAQEVQEAATPSERPSRRGRAPKAAEPPPEQPEEASEPPAEPSEWFAQLRDASDPEAALDLLARNLPREALERHQVISGLVGNKADQLARERAIRAQKEAEEQAKLQAAQNNDLYTLGEIAQREIQTKAQQEAAARATGPFMDGVVLFQQQLPEQLQKLVAGRTFGEGKGQAAGVAEYLQFLHEEGVKLATEQSVRARESALRKSVLTEVNGGEPTPERESGTPARVREVTDEQIAAMSLREYDALFDENGHPKPGVRHRATRGIPLRPH